MATAKKSSGKSSKQSAPTKEDKFVTLSIEMPAELLIMIDEFAKEDEISAPEELALMIQIGLQARLEDMVEIKKEKAPKAPAKKAPAKKEEAPKAPAKKAPTKKEEAPKAAAKKAPAKKEEAPKAAAKKAPAKKAPAKK